MPEHRHIPYIPVLALGLQSLGPIDPVGAGVYYKSLFIEDTDFDTDEVLSTGLGSSYGLLVLRESVGGITAIYRLDNQTITAVSAHADFSTSKDTASKYNVYWETDQYKIQNKVGNNKNIRVGFFGI